MTDKSNTEQIQIMKEMLVLAQKQTDMSETRTEMSQERSEMSQERSKMSADRSEMSETRSYHNAERTLSVWVRTALSLMIFGMGIDRFGLLLQQVPGDKNYTLIHTSASLEAASSWVGAALVLLAIFMAASSGIRFFAYALDWRKRHRLPAHHGPYLATFYTAMVAIFGLVLLIFMIFFAS